MLTRADGPECPRCGCCQGDTLESYARTTYERRDGHAVPVDEETVLRIACGHCRYKFSAVAKYTNGQYPDAEEIPFPTLHCPTCGSKNNYVTSTRTAGLRYHRCRSCDCNFKTRELS